MGQKAHPYGLRLGYIKPWKGKWFSAKDAANLLEEDLNIRNQIRKNLSHAGIGNVEIERSSGRVRVRIFSARPGVIIGRRGQEIDKIKDLLNKLTKSEVFLDIKEIKAPQLVAQLVAENVAMQLEKRIGFRRAMKKAIQLAMQRGALGIKVQVKGRLGGADIARAEVAHEGKVPLSTFRADVDYGFTEARTTYGAIGCKVWIYKGDILVKKEEADKRQQREKSMLEAELAEKKLKSKAATKKEEASAAPEPKAEETKKEGEE